MVSPNVNDTSLEKQLDPYVRKQNAKLAQVVQNFFTKAVQVISAARSEDNSERHTDSRINRWFNLLLPSSDLYKDELKLWKACTDLSNIPPLIIETYIDLRQLSDRTAIVLKDENNNAWTVTKSGSKKHEVVIERWLIEFDPHQVSGSIIDELPLIYKQAIILFRSLFGYLRLMPAYKLKQNLNKDKSNRITIGNKVLDGKQPISSRGRIGLSKSIIPHQMLTTDSHLVQRQFQPIQTTLGTLKVSIAYRRHYNFCVHDSEEVLSTHFINSDKQQHALSQESSRSNQESQHLEKAATMINEPETNQEEFGPAFRPQRYSASMSVSPNSSGMKENSPSPKKDNNTPPVSKPSFQPFKVGSISTSPPPSNQTYGASSLERRISITSNKSASNASLAAMLRNPRGSNSSTTGSATIPISNTSVHTASFPRSISSSHGSTLAHENESPVPESVSNTPRFSSSFGSRASRRFSNTSIRQSLLHTNSLNDQTSLLGTSAGAASSVNPLSGIYIDDDISDFVRMIDSKSDLRFNNANDSKANVGSNSQLEVLSKFQSLRLHHQQLGDSVNQSLILQATPPPPPHQATGLITSGHGSSPSRASSRKSSHSIYSGSAGSYDPLLPTISSRLEKEMGRKPVSASADAPVKPAPKKDVVGLSTTPSTYKRRSIQYENVFEDDDGEDYFLQQKDINKPASAPLPARNDEDEDDDLLFTMSDMNLAKG